jgi:hypothetical protein
MLAMPFPWPARSSRHEVIAAARAERERSQAAAADAAVITGQIRALAAENHFAARIAEDIIRRHSPRREK